jgi:hypothetical protein
LGRFACKRAEVDKRPKSMETNFIDKEEFIQLSKNQKINSDTKVFKPTLTITCPKLALTGVKE